MFDKNYFLTRMRNGESIDEIGQSIADMMNDAVDAYEAEQAVRENAEARRKLVRCMVNDINELAKLDGCEDLAVSLTDEEADDLVTSFTDMFKLLAAIKETADTLTKTTSNTQKQIKPAKATNDDAILANFLRDLGL
jgi:regulator of protease activity HflC (stomatin/prohibitin superfamily)